MTPDRLTVDAALIRDPFSDETGDVDLVRASAYDALLAQYTVFRHAVGAVVVDMHTTADRLSAEPFDPKSARAHAHRTGQIFTLTIWGEQLAAILRAHREPA